MPDLPAEDELQLRTSRSGGPGGQHVNKTESRVEAIWDFEGSSALSDAQRDLIRDRLRHRLDRDGRLVVASSSERSQHRNRRLAIERLRSLVAAALVVTRPRKRTRPSRAARERRLADKRHQARKKADRRTSFNRRGD